MNTKGMTMFHFEQLSDIPANSNPFNHDAISVGATLANIGLPNVYVMDSGTFGPGFYIVNTETGQRVLIHGIEGK